MYIIIILIIPKSTELTGLRPCCRAHLLKQTTLSLPPSFEPAADF